MRVLVFLLLAASARAAQTPKTAHGNLRAAIEAHMDGDDALARKRLTRCLALAPADSFDATSCRIYSQEWAEGVPQIDKPSNPYSRYLFSIGAEYYKEGSLEEARQYWTECLGWSEPGTAVRVDCLAMMDLLPPRPVALTEKKGYSEYTMGRLFRAWGATDAARGAWTACLGKAPEGSDTRAECEAALKALGAPKK